jgi:tRNA (guanine-N7-)-methyltransferase
MNDLRAHRAFFGRVSGKRLHKGQRALFDSLLPELAVELPSSGQINLEKLFPGNPAEKILEIGYGGGEHLARMAAQHPRSRFIGCEVYTGGIGKLLQKIDEEKLANISLFCEDAYRLLKALPSASLESVYLLYPAPWPKSRHNKRRFISNITLEELARVIRPGGIFYFATDIEDYANWTLAHMLRQVDFAWQTKPQSRFWQTPFPGWVPTRYEAKARREGRTQSFYFSFERVK